MSAQAAKIVRESQILGSRKAVLMALAHKSRQRSAPFMAEACYRDLMADTGLSKSTVIRGLAEAITEGEIWIAKKGGGRAKNTYAIDIRGVSNTKGAGVSPRHPSSEENPRVLSSRTCIPTEILYAEVDDEYGVPNVIPIDPKATAAAPRKTPQKGA